MARFQFRDCTKLTSSWDYSWVDCGLLGCGAVGGVPALTVLGEHSHVPDRVLHVQALEPAEQQVVVQLLH